MRTSVCFSYNRRSAVKIDVRCFSRSINDVTLSLQLAELLSMRLRSLVSAGKKKKSVWRTERVLLLIPAVVTCNSRGKWQIEKIIMFPTPVQIYCSAALRSLISICLSCQ